ncbi:DUF6087 family protein [Streptomyces ossamyceticus]|nr:DUF6087 family protein [Streptomyces ossamyceticus]
MSQQRGRRRLRLNHRSHGQALPTGPPNQLPRAVPRVDADDRLAAYNRRRAPLDVWRRHHPLDGGDRHLRPGEPRAREEWNGFTFEPAGTAANLTGAQRWVNEQTTDTTGRPVEERRNSD